MKKTSFYLVLLFALVSCNNEDLKTNEGNLALQSRFSNSTDYGQVHNDFMDFINNDFTPDGGINLKNDGYNYVVSFFNNKASSYNQIKKDEKEALLKSINDNAKLLETSDVQKIINNQINISNPISNTQTSLSQLILDLKNQNVISLDEYEEINDFQNVLTKVNNSELSATDLNDYVNKLDNRIEGKNYKIIEPMVSVAKYSNNWWNDNTPTIYLPLPIGEVTHPSNQYTTYALPVAVGTDIAGALIGGAMSAAIQYGANGNVNWGIVGASAVGGAIVGSTGVVGKLGKWISSLF